MKQRSILFENFIIECRLEEKEQIIVRQEQELQRNEQKINELKFENQTLASELHEKSSQTQNLRGLVATLENTISQKNFEIQIRKSRLAEAVGDDFQSGRPGLRTPPGRSAFSSKREENQLLDDYRSYIGSKNPLESSNRSDRKLSRQTKYISGN